MKRIVFWLSLVLVVFLAGAAGVVQDADARAGGGRSFGGSGSRSFGAPSRSYSGTSTGTSAQQPGQIPAGGGFLRGMGGGIVGGMLGGMLFSSLGFGGTGGGLGGSGIGLFEIALFGGIAYMLFSMMRKRREAGLAYEGQQAPFQDAASSRTIAGNGLEEFRRMNPSFDENRFRETVMDIFFKVQGCWTNRDMTAGNDLVTDQMQGIFREDIDKLIKDSKINRLENIAVRKVEVVEAWQEAGLEYAKALFTANLLDYTVDDKTGDVVAGSKTDPVKFEEYWTFSRTIGSTGWRLTAISQV